MKNLTLSSAIVLGLVSTAACASSEYGRTTTPRDGYTAPQLDLVLVDTTARASLPARVSPAAAPDLGRNLDNQILVEQDGRAQADVRLCIAGDGHVADVAVVRSSGIAALDAALIAEARTWQYQPLASSAATACHAAQIRYAVR